MQSIIQSWVDADPSNLYGNFCKFFLAKQFLYKTELYSKYKTQINRKQKVQLDKRESEILYESTFLTNMFINDLVKAYKAHANKEALRLWARNAKLNAKVNLKKHKLAQDLLKDWNEHFDEIAAGTYNLFTEEMREQLRIEPLQTDSPEVN